MNKLESIENRIEAQINFINSIEDDLDDPDKATDPYTREELKRMLKRQEAALERFYDEYEEAGGKLR